MPPCEVASRTIFCFQFGIFEKWPSPHKNLVRGSSHQILVRKSATRQWNGFEQGFLRLKCPVFVFFRFFFALSKMHMGSSGRQSACVPDSVLAHVSRAHQYWLGPWTPRCRTQGGLCGSRRPDDPMPILMIENRNPFPFSRIIGIGSHTKIPCYGIRNTKTWSDQRVCEQSPRLWPKKQKFVTLSLTATTVTFWPQTSRSPSHFGCRSKCVLLWFVVTVPGFPRNRAKGERKKGESPTYLLTLSSIRQPGVARSPPFSDLAQGTRRTHTSYDQGSFMGFCPCHDSPAGWPDFLSASAVKLAPWPINLVQPVSKKMRFE